MATTADCEARGHQPRADGVVARIGLSDLGQRLAHDANDMHICNEDSGRRGSSERFPVSTMTTMTTTRPWLAILAAAVALPALGIAQGSDLGDRVLALKQSLEKDQGELRKYEWIETTVITYKNEEKSSTQQRCYYGADGNLQKVPVASEPGRHAWRPEGQGGKAQEGRRD